MNSTDPCNIPEELKESQSAIEDEKENSQPELLVQDSQTEEVQIIEISQDIQENNQNEEQANLECEEQLCKEEEVVEQTDLSSAIPKEINQPCVISEAENCGDNCEGEQKDEVNKCCESGCDNLNNGNNSNEKKDNNEESKEMLEVDTKAESKGESVIKGCSEEEEKAKALFEEKIQNLLDQAQQLKKEGNDLFKAGDLKKARAKYARVFAYTKGLIGNSGSDNDGMICLINILII